MPTTTWYPAADTYVGSSSPTTDYSAQSSMTVSKAQTSDKINIQQAEAYIRFFTAPIPAISVSSASLRLYITSGTSTATELFRVTGNPSWTTGVTYNNRQSLSGTTRATSNGAAFTLGGTTGQQTINLSTSQILAMMTQDWSGFRLEPTSSDTSFGSSFASKEATEGSSYWPMLTVTYTENTAPTIAPSTAEGALSPTSTPPISVLITDPNTQPLTVTVEVSATNFGTVLQTKTSNVVGPYANGTVTTTMDALAPGVYYWRAKVTDGFATSAYTTPRSFTVNTAPTIVPITADNMVSTSPTPTLQVEITDPNSGQTLTTEFTVSAVSNFSSILQTKTSTVSSPRTNYNREAKLDSLPDGVYFWRARVSDGSLFSAYTPTRSFTIGTLIAYVGTGEVKEMKVGTSDVDAAFIGDVKVF